MDFVQDKYQQQQVTDSNQAILDAARTKLSDLQQGKMDATAITKAMSTLVTASGIQSATPGKINVPAGLNYSTASIGNQTNNSNDGNTTQHKHRL